MENIWKAIPFITYDDDFKFNINPEAIEFLKTLENI
jgi:hypothetical protein